MPARCCSDTFKRFERQNPDYSLTIFECPTTSKGREDLQPAYMSNTSDESRPNQITLILLYDAKAGAEHTGHHYITVSNIQALLRGEAQNEEAHCLRCFHTFAGVGAASRLAQHRPECCGINGGGVQRVTMPTPDKNILEFTDYEKKLRAPFAIYLDFESSLLAVPDAEQPKSCQKSKLDGNVPNTERLQVHRTNSYRFITIGPDGKRYDGVDTDVEYNGFYRGPDAAKHCLERLSEVGGFIEEDLQEHRERSALTPQEEASWRSAEVCHICEEGDMTRWAYKSGKPNASDKVRDHCHVTGKFRGAAHSRCNLKVRTCYDVPVFVHNLKGYDAHLLFQEMEKVDGKIKVIATNSEKYVSFKFENLVFKDSLQFLSCGLAKLTENLPRDEFAQTSVLAEEEDIPIGMLQRKGVYPYSWVDSDEKFSATELPPIEAFHDDLDDRPCRPDDYAHAVAVWEAARCKTFGDYHDLYLRLDVALLADVFESFRRSAHKTYGIDPAHFYTLPGVSWAAMLKYTGVKLELLTDPDMYIAMESALRGGVCAVTHRHAKANNPRVGGYDPKVATTWLRYDDANNLYGLAMSQCLPVRGFVWGSGTTWTLMDIGTRASPCR